MKRKIIAWTATILIITLVSYAFLRPAPSDFGYGDKLYTPTRETIELLSGSEHFIVENRGVIRHNSIALELRIIRKDPEQLYTRGTMRIKDNQELDKETTSGIMERFDDGEWVNIGWAGANFFYTMQGRTDAASIHDFFLLHENNYYDEGGAYYPLVLNILGSPGRYRVTLYFRECFNYGTEYNGSWNDGPIYTTGEELIELTFELEIPEVVEAIDVAGVEVYANEGVGGAATIFLRSNHASPVELIPGEGYVVAENAPPYLDTASLTLEQRVGEVYLPVKTGEDAGLELSAYGYRYSPDDVPEYYRHELDWYDSTPDRRTDKLAYYEIALIGDDFDPEAEYRVTMNFVENEDGSGETYTLRLRLKFSE